MYKHYKLYDVCDKTIYLKVLQRSLKSMYIAIIVNHNLITETRVSVHVSDKV